MNKLLTSLACGTVLSMSLMGVGFAESAVGTDGMGNTVPGLTGARAGQRVENGVNRAYQQGTNMMNQTTGTVNRTENRVRDTLTGNNYNNNTVRPLSTTTPNGRYRATSTATTTTGNGSNWGWLGLLGLLGLVGMRNRGGERERH